MRLLPAGGWCDDVPPRLKLTRQADSRVCLLGSTRVAAPVIHFRPNTRLLPAASAAISTGAAAEAAR